VLNEADDPNLDDAVRWVGLGCVRVWVCASAEVVCVCVCVCVRACVCVLLESRAETTVSSNMHLCGGDAPLVIAPSYTVPNT
jgi:hypothetical protein